MLQSYRLLPARSRHFGLLILLVLTVASAGMAEEPVQRERSAAFDAGRSAMVAQRWEEALSIYGRLWAERPTYDVALQLGVIELNLKKYKDAVAHFTFGLENFPPKEPLDKAERARRLLDKAKERVGNLNIRVTPQQAEIRVDGELVGRSPLAGSIMTDPGAHTVEAVLAGHASASAAVTVADGETRLVELSLIPVGSNAPSPPLSSAAAAPLAEPGAPPPTASNSTAGGVEPRTIALIAGAAVTVVAGVVSVVYAVKASSAGGRVEQLREDGEEEFGEFGCATPAGSSAATCKELEAANDDRESASRAANISFGVAAGGAAITGAMFFLWPKSHEKQATSSKNDSTAMRPKLRAVATPNFAGALLSGSF